MVKHLITLSLLFVFGYTSAQTFIKGKVVDSKGQGIFAANIYLKNSMQYATAAETDGSFRLKIPQEASDDTLCVRFIGYRDAHLPLQQIQPTELVRIVLHENIFLLDEAIVKHNPNLSEEFSVQQLNKMDVYLSPVANGDPLNAITFLPMSTNMSENANPEFRGSASNASQVILNGIPIANPVRNTQVNGMGNFSLFNIELIEELTVYGSNPPLAHGNAIAGATEITTTAQLDENQTQVALSMANVGLLRSQKLGEKQFLQAYANYQFSPVFTALNAAEHIKSFGSKDMGLNYHFQGKNFSMNAYSYFIDETFSGKEYSQGMLLNSQAGKTRNFNILNLRYHTERLIFEFNGGNDLSTSSYHFGSLKFKQKDASWTTTAQVKYLLNDALFLQAGLSAQQLQVDFDIQKPLYRFAKNDSLHLQQVDTTTGVFLPETFLYLRLKPNRHFVFGAGIRKGFNKELFSPLSFQANLRYTFFDRHSLLLSGGHYHGYYYPNSYSTSISKQASKQLSFEYHFGGENTQLHAAVYQKEEEGLHYFDLEEKMQASERRMSGIEVSGSQNFGAFKIAASYTCLDSRIKLGDTWYKMSNNTPCFVKASVSHTSKEHFSISCIGTFRPGLRYTPIIGGLYHEDVHAFEPVYGEYNSLRYDSYKRVDFSLNKVIFQPNGNRLVLFAVLSNEFDFKNQAGHYYSYDYSQALGKCYLQGHCVYLGTQYSF